MTATTTPLDEACERLLAIAKSADEGQYISTKRTARAIRDGVLEYERRLHERLIKAEEMATKLLNLQRDNTALREQVKGLTDQVRILRAAQRVRH